uniref:Major facilitator superfamily (MFS) profile domain-containing protein n=1 Tax=Panagrolaimus sp. JU765 TaxID=591449 RepID=A0AC34R194_9BILA
MMAFISIILGLDIVLGKHVNILVIGAAIANFFAFLIILPFHETPKYLYISRVDKKSTIESIEFYLGNEFNSNDYFVEIEQEALLIAGRKKTVKEFLTERPTRQAAILSILALQNTTPYWSILLASTFFFQKAGISKEISQISTASTIFVYFFGTIVGMFWIQKFKRRTFIICFTAFNISTLAFYTIFDLFSPKFDFLKYGCLVCLAVYGFTFGAGAGPVNQIVGVELVTQKDKSLLQAVSQTGNQFAVIIITGALMPLFELIRSITFIILFVIPSTISLVYLYFKMPETRDRSLNEITKDLE